MTVAVLPAPRRRHRREALRWIASALIVLLFHAGGAIGIFAWRMPSPPVQPPPAAILIDLTPQPTAPQAAEAPPLVPAEKIEVPAPEPEPALPPPPAPRPVVALPPPPPPKPIERKPLRHRPEPHKPLPEPRPAPPAPVAAESAPAPPPAAPSRAEPTPSVAAAPSPVVLSDFERRLLAHLEQQKHYPRSAQRRREQGVVYLRFIMDRTGKVLSARIERSSGHADLDQEVLALIRRAEPLPAFPAEMPQAKLELIAPFQFFLR